MRAPIEIEIGSGLLAIFLPCLHCSLGLQVLRMCAGLCPSNIAACSCYWTAMIHGHAL